MRPVLGITGNSRTIAAAIAAAFVLFAAAEARTANFYSSFPVAPGPMTALSTAGDNAGQSVSLNQWMALVFVQPFGVSKTDTVSIFTLPPSIGDAQLTIRIGSYNGGSPIFVDSKTINAGNSFTFANLFKQGCSALGGCDFIEITTTRQRKGATGAVVDYVSVNGEPTEVTAPTPEPSIWAMMLIGFGAVAWRLKAYRGSSRGSAKGAPAICRR